MDVPFVTSLFRRKSHSDRATKVGTIHYQAGSSPVDSFTLSCPLGAASLVGAPTPPLRASCGMRLKQVQPDGASWLGGEGGPGREGEAGEFLPAMSSEKCASKAPGREAQRQAGGVLSSGLQTPVKALLPSPLLPSQSRDEGPVPCTVPGTRWAMQMPPINWQAASIHFRHRPPPQESDWGQRLRDWRAPCSWSRCSCPPSHSCMPLLSHLSPTGPDL